MKLRFKDIPSLIRALERNQIIWDYLIDMNSMNLSKDVARFISKELDKCSKRRTKMSLELSFWLDDSIKKYNKKLKKKIKAVRRKW